MSQKVKCNGFDIFAAFVVGLVFGALISGGCVNDYQHRRAIENGAASYNQTTGVFEWKDGK